MLVCLCVVCGLLRDVVWFVFCVCVLCVLASVFMCLCVVCALSCEVV